MSVVKKVLCIWYIAIFVPFFLISRLAPRCYPPLLRRLPVLDQRHSPPFLLQ